MKQQNFNKQQLGSVFDWNTALETAVLLQKLAAPKKGFNREPQKLAYEQFTEEISELAGDWVTCACGNQCSAIPRGQGGVPLDARLYDLGLKFSRQVAKGEWENAKRTLQYIENRSAKLLSKQH